MLSEFQFATAAKIVFGCGTSAQLGKFVKDLGATKVMVMHYKHFPERCEKQKQEQEGAGLFDMESLQKNVLSSVPEATFTTHVVSGEPTLEVMLAALAKAKEAGVELIVAYGGGSVIDTAKAVAGLAANGGDPLDYLEVVGLGKPLAKPALPVIALPTTAGTGSEVTKNAVICCTDKAVKVSMRADSLLPRVAIVDPLLTVRCPRVATRNAGLDALTQCIEPYVSCKHNPLTDALCREGIARAARSVARACSEPGCLPAREDMCVASLIGGICLANAKLGLVHGFAGPLGGMLPNAPHGYLCAVFLAPVIAANICAIRADKRSDDDDRLARFAEVARIATGRQDATPEDLVEWVAGLCKSLEVPPLREFGLTEDMIPELIRKVGNAGSTKGNPIVLPPEELEKIARACL